MQIKNINFYSYVFAMPVIISTGFLFGLFSQPYSFIPVCTCFSIFYTITVIHAIVQYGAFSLYSLYLYTSFFFIYSKIFFTALGLVDFLYVDFPGKHQFSKTTGIIFIAGSFISFYLLDIYYYIQRQKVIKNIQLIDSHKYRLIHNKNLQDLGLCIMLITFPIILYKLYIQIQIIKAEGYLGLYTGVLDKIQYPIWTKGSGTLFYLGFLFVLISYPSKRKFICSATLFILFNLTNALKGGRGGFISSVLAIIYFYQQFYGVRITIKKLFVPALILCIFSAVIGELRMNNENNSSKNMVSLLQNFIMGQNTSIGSPLAIIEFKSEQNQFRKYPYIYSILLAPFYNIISPDTANVPSLERLYVRNEMESICTYIYSQQMYLSGFGIGASFSGEMFDHFGFMGIIFWTLMLGSLIISVERMKYKSNWFLLCAWFTVCSIILLPRSHFFDFVYSGYCYFIFAWLFIMILNFFIFPKKIMLKKRSV